MASKTGLPAAGGALLQRDLKAYAAEEVGGYGAVRLSISLLRPAAAVSRSIASHAANQRTSSTARAFAGSAPSSRPLPLQPRRGVLHVAVQHVLANLVFLPLGVGHDGGLLD